MINDDVQQVKQETHLIPVHISWDEVLYFNYLQELVTGHQQDVDPETGLRSYPGLSEAVRIPEIREIFMAAAEMHENGESLGPDIEGITEQEDEKIRARGIPPIPSDEEPDIQKLAATGEDEDKVLVMMPQDVVQFLDIIQGGEKKDPAMGLQEFGFFSGKFGNFVKSIVRVGATVGGAFLGGPLGAAAGNMAGRWVTGQKPGKDMLIAGGKNALYSYGAGKALGAVGMGGLGGNAGNIGAGAKAMGLSNPFSSGAVASTAAANPIAAPAGTAAASSGFGSLVSQYGPGLAMMGGGLYLGSRNDKKKQQEYQQDKREHERKNKIVADNWNADGLNEPLLEPEYLPEDLHKGPLKRYKGGGKVLAKPIVGRGKGQEDLIKVTVPEKTWIDNATFVADAGDGSTKAGHKEIEKLEKYVVNNHLTPDVIQRFKQDIKVKPLRPVPCAFSDGEREKKPLLVAAFGRGSNDKGAAILRDMVTTIRKHKVSKGHQLPPPCPDLITVYKKIAHKHLGGRV